MMVDRKLYKGIEYVEVAELPEVQRQSLEQTISKDLYIKILIDGTIVPNCLQFKDYSRWYNSVYSVKNSTVITSEAVTATTADFSAKKLVFK